MHSFFLLIDEILGLYADVLLAMVVISWLISFNVINTRNRFVYTVSDWVNRLTEPALKPIRRVLPNIGGLDLSPLLLFLLIGFLRNLMRENGLLYY